MVLENILIEDSIKFRLAVITASKIRIEKGFQEVVAKVKTSKCIKICCLEGLLIEFNW